MEENEVLLKIKNEWRHFSNPHCIISASKPGEVRGALREVEGLVASNRWHAAGFVSYEAACAFDPAFQTHPAGEFPLLWFGLYSESRMVELPAPGRGLDSLTWQPTTSEAEYRASIEKIKDHIARGNTYQVNYTMRLVSEMTGGGWDLFLALARTQNQYAAYINTGRYEICSASPELFFRLDGDKIYSRPMKGTVKRGRTTGEDQTQADWLHNSPKNRAENVMIVDMVRNDLGRIAETGSVRVPELFHVEKYPTLLQMTSTVQARTTASITDIFAALFPCASITGAPKISTMKLISGLEITARKIYTGSIGYLSPERDAQFNVAIRTVLVDREAGKAEYGVGGGIVWDSTSADEYQEALLKARVLTEAPQEFHLFETLLWDPAGGYFLPDKHMARLADSAEYFDFHFSGQDFLKALEDHTPVSPIPMRVKVILRSSGEITVESAEFIPPSKPMRVKLADHPVQSRNMFYFHKTSRREIYPALDGYDDVLLHNEQGELTEFTIGNLVVEMGGRLLTPPISCGLLAGTFRAHLLETGKIAEQVIRKEEVANCTHIYLVNSLRKWVDVKI
ncbi:MAG: aminodeoxychorismate synthase component I [Chloroflexi bacterium]|nr:aminodeoxychorismate synthase component I [Chloroflexota bacterium]